MLYAFLAVAYLARSFGINRLTGGVQLCLRTAYSAETSTGTSLLPSSSEIVAVIPTLFVSTHPRMKCDTCLSRILRAHELHATPAQEVYTVRAIMLSTGKCLCNLRNMVCSRKEPMQRRRSGHLRPHEPLRQAQPFVQTYTTLLSGSPQIMLSHMHGMDPNAQHVQAHRDSANCACCLLLACSFIVVCTCDSLT